MRFGRLLFLAAVLAALLCLFCVTASAETEGIFSYTVTDGEATVTFVDTGELEEIVVPETLGGYPVTKLDNNLFFGGFLSNSDLFNGEYHNTHPLKRVVLPDGVKELPSQLFGLQYSLEEVRLPADLETIGSLCFAYCISLRHIDLPEGLVAVESGAFCDCWSLESVIFPESLREVGVGSNGPVFDYTAGLRYVYLPAGITTLSMLYKNTVYSGQTASFSDLYFGGTEERFNALTTDRYDGVTYHFETDPASLKPPYSVSFADGILTVTGSGEIAFGAEETARPWDDRREETQTLVLDGDFTRIGENAFAGLPSLAIVILRTGAAEIASGAFADCPSLTDVIALGGCSAAADAFPAENGVNVFAENITAPAGAGWNPVAVSYADVTLTYDGSLTQNAYDFFDILSVFCDRYGEIDRLNVTDFAFEGVPVYYYEPETGRRTRITDSLRNGVIYPRLEKDGETVAISFNDLCEGIADHSIDSFYLVINDEIHQETEDTPVSIVEQIKNTIQRILRTIVTLLNKLFRLLNALKTN